MVTVNIYLTFKGNCEAAFMFYKSVFGGEFQFMGRFKDMPPVDGVTVTPDVAEKIMHVSLPISKETILMGSDSSEAFGQTTIIGNNFSVSVKADSNQDADMYFAKLCDGGKVNMPMEETFWGSYFGMLTDKFGINWMVSHEKEPTK